MRAQARRLCRSEADADDLVQRALLKAWAARDRVPVENPRSFLITILCNLWRDDERKRRRRPLHDGDDAITRVASPEPEPSPLYQRTTFEDLVGALGELPEHMRLTFELAELQRLPYEEVASRLGVASGTVGGRLTRARKELKSILTRRLFGDAGEGEGGAP